MEKVTVTEKLSPSQATPSPTGNGTKPPPWAIDIESQFKKFQPPNYRADPHVEQLARYAAQVAVEAVKVWVNDALAGKGRGIVLWATSLYTDSNGHERSGWGYGNGKTLLAQCAHNALVANGFAITQITFETTERFLERVKASYDSNSTANLFREYRRSPAIFLDDLGTEYARRDSMEWYQEQWYKLLNHTYDARQPLLITSNLTPIQMQERIGGKNWSRLYGHCDHGKSFVNMSAIPDQR